jgi:neurofibromin 1
LEGVVDSLLLLLEELSRSHTALNLHPAHILHSEIYIIHLLSECCTENWRNVGLVHDKALSFSKSDSSSRSSLSDLGTISFDDKHESSILNDGRNPPNSRALPPKALEDALVSRILDAVKLFQTPISESYTLPASNILDDGTSTLGHLDASSFSDSTSSGSTRTGSKDTTKLLDEKAEDIELHIRSIVEFVSASNWNFVLEHLRATIRGLRGNYASQASSGAGSQPNSLPEDDTNDLVTLRLVALLWVDARKLGQIIQEFCGSFLHLKKSFQNMVAIVLPLLITRWLEQNPGEFVDLHITHKRLDGGADTLFDMTNSMVDSGRWKSLLYPFQTALIFLLPDVFEVASNMRDAKSSSMVKKVTFLESLRKALRNRNPAAAYCLVSLLRVARHFRLDSDSALLSFALDVQDEVREAVFRRFITGGDSAIFDDSLLTAAFVSLAHLNFDTCNQNLAPLCLATNAPQDFKIAYISACCYFARQSNVEYYQPLFRKASVFIRSHLKVSC